MAIWDGISAFLIAMTSRTRMYYKSPTVLSVVIADTGVELEICICPLFKQQAER